MVKGRILLPCPECGESKSSNLWFQTPVEGDGMIRRYYVMCANCWHEGPHNTFARPMTSDEVGRQPVAPLYDAWNAHVAGQGRGEG